MKWIRRNDPGLVANHLNIRNRWGIKIVLNEYIDLSGSWIHNHRQDFVSFIFKSGYYETKFWGEANLEPSDLIQAPAIIHRRKELFHRVHSIPGKPCWTLQIYYGKKIKQETY